MPEPRVDPNIVSYLTDVYRLSRYDGPSSVGWFVKLCRDGYHPRLHRDMLIEFDGHRRGTPNRPPEPDPE